MEKLNITFKHFIGINGEAILIRKVVFIDEQQYIVDIDENDNTCLHFVEYLNNIPVGTCRVLKYKENSLKLGRFAILKEYRGHALGTKLLNEVEKYATENNFDYIYLDAQFDKKEFYFKSGYKSLNLPLFLDENYPHIHLYKKL